MHIIILAAGLGSRLSKFTHDIIPKYLINIDDNTGLFYLIQYWCQYSKNIHLVIHSKYDIITKFYINNILTKYSEYINIIHYDNNDGTAYTLNYILNNNLKDVDIKNLLLTWCDLYPNENIDFNKLKNKIKNKNNIYIFTNGNNCRYKLNANNKIEKVEDNNGNIVGIYYFNNYKKFTLDNNCLNNDIVEYLENIGDIYNFNINNITDYGDENKLLNIINNQKINKFKCRYFNNIELIDEDKLLKKGITCKGKDIIKKEKKWYEYIKTLNNNEVNNLIPKIYDTFESGFIIEYKKNFIPVYKFLDINKDNMEQKIEVLNNIINKINIIHDVDKNNVSKILFFNNLRMEINTKIIERKKIINDVLNYFGKIEYVNNLKIDTFENILNKCKNIIVQYYETIDVYEYSIIIGDCQFSNILIDPDNINNIAFIDPRGYFGNTEIFGPTEYDYAKILYGISGYDNFNSSHFNINNINVENKSITFEIESITFDKKIINKYFNKVHKAFIIIIWLSLAEYNKNNIWKCLSSYYYGLYLGTLLK